MTEEEKQAAIEGLRLREGIQLAERPGPDGWWRIRCQEPEAGRSLMHTLFREQAFWCDLLVSVSGSHHPGPPGRMEVRYHVESLIRGWKFEVCFEKPAEPGEKVSFPGFSDLWKAAEWHERETAELFGLVFDGHPWPRPLLLPADWEGYPLRKDYQPAVRYHGLRIRYERNDPPEETLPAAAG